MESVNHLQLDSKATTQLAKEMAGGDHVPKSVVKNLRQKAKVLKQKQELELAMGRLREYDPDSELYDAVTQRTLHGLSFIDRFIMMRNHRSRPSCWRG